MNEFIEKIKVIQTKKLFFVVVPLYLCKLPYPEHKRGCPNIGKNKNCPPYAKKLNIKYDLNKQSFLCYVKFNIKKQKEKMKLLHPEWSDKQCKCLLYWQKSVVRELKHKCIFYMEKIFIDMGCCDYELIPEAMGLNVFETMKYHGIELERNPENYVYKIAFIGVLK